MQCECVAIPCKEYIFIKDKAQWRWSKSTLRYTTLRGVNVLDWPGNSADITPIDEVWNIKKKKSGKLPNNKKKNVGITFVTYGMVFIEKLLRNRMPSMVEVVRKAKMGLPCTELLKTMA